MTNIIELYNNSSLVAYKCILIDVHQRKYSQQTYSLKGSAAVYFFVLINYSGLDLSILYQIKTGKGNKHIYQIIHTSVCDDGKNSYRIIRLHALNRLGFRLIKNKSPWECSFRFSSNFCLNISLRIFCYNILYLNYFWSTVNLR